MDTFYKVICHFFLLVYFIKITLKAKNRKHQKKFRFQLSVHELIDTRLSQNKQLFNFRQM